MCEIILPYTILHTNHPIPNTLWGTVLKGPAAVEHDREERHGRVFLSTIEPPAAATFLRNIAKSKNNNTIFNSSESILSPAPRFHHPPASLLAPSPPFSTIIIECRLQLFHSPLRRDRSTRNDSRIIFHFDLLLRGQEDPWIQE